MGVVGGVIRRLLHRLGHFVMANTSTHIIEIDGELWIVAECRKCKAEVGRWFYRHQMKRRSRKE